MEIVHADVQDEDASEVLRQVQSAVQTMQRPSVVDTNEQVHAQLETGDVTILPAPGDSTPCMSPRIGLPFTPLLYLKN